MSQHNHASITYDRLLKEARNSLRVSRAIIQAKTLAEAQTLAAGLERQLVRYLQPDPPKRRR